MINNPLDCGGDLSTQFGRFHQKHIFSLPSQGKMSFVWSEIVCWPETTKSISVSSHLNDCLDFHKKTKCKTDTLCLIWWLRWIFLELKRLSAGYKAIGELFNLNQKINAATKKALYSMHWWELGNDTIINTWINSSRSCNFIIPENTS